MILRCVKLSLIKTVNQEILDLYLFSDLIKRQLTISNNDEIEIDLFIVSFPFTTIPCNHQCPSAWIYIPWS
jgi:hypothetical protein